MSNDKYRFKIDEPAPHIPPAQNFGAMLATVKAKKMWYSKPWVWGGTAVFTAAVAVGSWYYSQNAKPTEIEVKTPVKTEDTAPALTPVVEEKTALYTPKTRVQTPATVSAPPALVEEKIEPHADNKVVENIQPPVVIPVQEVHTEKATPIESIRFQWFTLPYDTFTIDNTQKPGYLELKDNSSLELPADAWEDENGKQVNGPVQVLYRECRDQAAMLFAGISFTSRVDGNSAGFTNNGAFEIKAIKNGKPLRLRPNHSLLLNFSINNTSSIFSGYQYYNVAEAWETMDVSNRITQDSSAFSPIHKGQLGYDLIRPRGFFGWLRALFKRPVYRKLKDAEWGEGDSVKSAYKSEKTGISKGKVTSKRMSANTRTFEITQTGWFGSGKTAMPNNAQSMNFRYRVASADSFNNGVYLVYLNSNRIAYYPTVGHAVLSLTPADRCMLIAFSSTRNYVAFLDADRFEVEIKNTLFKTKQGMRRTENRDIVLELYKRPINNVEDLRNLINQNNQAKKRS